MKIIISCAVTAAITASLVLAIMADRTSRQAAGTVWTNHAQWVADKPGQSPRCIEMGLRPDGYVMWRTCRNY